MKQDLTQEIDANWYHYHYDKEKKAEQVMADTGIWNRVWSLVEKVNYASTPMFLVEARKA